MAGYRTSAWGGLTNYECETCPFSALDAGTMETHIAYRHPEVEIGNDAKLSEIGDDLSFSTTTRTSPESIEQDERVDG